MVAKGKGVGGGMEWEVRVSRCKLLYIEGINNKVLLYSTENYIQHPIRNHNGKNYEEKNVYIYIYTHTHTHTYIYIYTHTHMYN